MVAATLIHPWNEELVERGGRDRRPRLGRAAGASSTPCSSGSAEPCRYPKGSAQPGPRAAAAEQRPPPAGAADRARARRDTTHSPAESELLHRLRRRARRRAVWIGVHEGVRAALVLVAGLPQGADLAPRWRTLRRAARTGGSTADEHAVKARGELGAGRGAAVGRALHWHVAASRRCCASGWTHPVGPGGHRRRPLARGRAALDWELWSPHVRVGGVVAFHGARGGDPGAARRVVTELFGAGDPSGLRPRRRRKRDTPSRSIARHTSTRTSAVERIARHRDVGAAPAP